MNKIYVLRTITKVALLTGLLGTFFTVGFAQDSENSDEQAEQNTLSIEEIIVTGQRSFYLLRAQVESAKVAMYSNYNQYNLDDELDVECRRTDYTESLINTSRCWPVFFEKLVAENAQNFLTDGSLFLLQPQQLARQHSGRFEDLRANIASVAADYPAVAESLIELGTLEEALKRKKEKCMQQPAVLFIFRLCP